MHVCIFCKSKSQLTNAINDRIRHKSTGGNDTQDGAHLSTSKNITNDGKDLLDDTASINSDVVQECVKVYHFI